MVAPAKLEKADFGSDFSENTFFHQRDMNPAEPNNVFPWVSYLHLSTSEFKQLKISMENSVMLGSNSKLHHGHLGMIQDQVVHSSDIGLPMSQASQCTSSSMPLICSYNRISNKKTCQTYNVLATNSSKSRLSTTSNGRLWQIKRHDACNC